mgnify:CR=1 FL=1
MYIVDLHSAIREGNSRTEIETSISEFCGEVYEEMADDETLWVFAPNQYSADGCWPVGMSVAESIRAESPLVLKNVISVHTEGDNGGDFRPAYEEVLFLVKDKREYKFNKDAIRVEHVYKGNEWGGERETGSSAYHDTEVRRYNPEGKDPGNVWITELRDETPNEEVDESLPFDRHETFRRCIRAGSDEGETVFTVGANGSTESIIDEEGRDLEVLEVDF